MPASSLIYLGILSPLSGIGGSLVWPLVQRRLGWSNLRVLATLVGLAGALPLYACLGLLPAFRDGRVRWGGLTDANEMYGLAVYFVRFSFLTAGGH